MRFEVTILGSNSAVPAHGRHPTAQVLNYNEELFLIDCGEGTQMRMNDLRIKRNKIRHIFISHIHGDHYFGLIGLINSMNLAGRTLPLIIYGPPELEKAVMCQVELIGTQFNFPIHFQYTSVSYEHIVSLDNLDVFTLPLVHKAPCTGFLFKEKTRELNIKPEAIELYQLTVDQIKAVKSGKDIVLENGKTIPNKELVKATLNKRSYAYCTDTAYTEEIIPMISNVDLLYHEATFTQNEEIRAKETFHSTTIEAATMAKKVNTKKLLIGHFSARYGDLELLIEEARSVFPNTELALEQQTFIVG